MILVLLGTFVTDFKRPLVEIERLCEEGIITEEVIVQSGYTVFNEARHLTLRAFISPVEMAELHRRARVVITHAGAGSVTNAIKAEKKVIAIPRLAKYGEHVDDHQLEILHELAALNYILPWHDHVPLEEVLTKLDNFEPRSFIPGRSNMINYLINYVDSL
ncbi:glycosyltransferase [Mucilaginibacter sp.]|jgi:UDP-N-acetylglucosamine transferase subunit ALG13|uniref:glycosyltransferase n=1 Tax=Mucilaginibacter sp. TaxID=1882438 RepID=UPI002B895B84|nr:glycosyltransferase [Mucilaginibacter sp.]HTI61266.1 glycosyltransferase [Mucilaginibacter sp.]